MDDTEDDGRYPPNRRSPFPSSHRPKLPVRNSSFPPPISGNYAAADEDDEEEDERNVVDQAMDDPEAEDEDDDEEEHAGGSFRRARDDVDDDEDDSSDSLGKRRKLDKFAHGFEFAPRVTAAAAAASAAASPAVKPPPPSARNSPAEWSEDSTFVLLDAWGEFYLQNGRKSIRSDEWSEVAKRVCQSSRNSRSDAQCRNRLDTLKKKYKKEKSKMAENVNLGSEWVYFSKMDSLMSSPPPSSPVVARKPQQQKPPRLACGVDAGEYVFSSSKAYENRLNGTDEMRDSPGDTESEDDGIDDDGDDDDESDGLPPKMRKASWASESSFRIIADSIQKFGDIYEKIEIGKRQQMAELERMRKEFQRDLEVQKRQILERAQEEIAKIREEEGEEEEEEEEEEEDEGVERAEDDDDDDGDEADDST